VRAALAISSMAAVVIGVGMVYLPLGFIVAGFEGFAVLYVATYLDARREASGATSRRSRT